MGWVGSFGCATSRSNIFLRVFTSVHLLSSGLADDLPIFW